MLRFVKFNIECNSLAIKQILKKKLQIEKYDYLNIPTIKLTCTEIHHPITFSIIDVVSNTSLHIIKLIYDPRGRPQANLKESTTSKKTKINEWATRD